MEVASFVYSPNGNNMGRGTDPQNWGPTSCIHAIKYGLSYKLVSACFDEFKLGRIKTLSPQLKCDPRSG